jgi:SAM-dependent methyltransferase
MIYQNFVNAYQETFEKYSIVLARTVLGLARVYQRGRVLDAGCGNGCVSEIIDERLLEVYGIDLSPSMIARACMRNLKSCVFQQGDCLSLPFADSFLIFTSVIS